MGDSPEALLDFWFGNALRSPQGAQERVALWYSANEAFDREIERRFASLPERAARGELDGWLSQAGSALALVLVLDQLPRNLFRGSERAFAFDSKARAVATSLLEAGLDGELAPLQASFAYLPFEHSEDLADQERSVALFEALLRRAPPALSHVFESFVDYARRHRDLVERFGRFPHRNEALGREPTAEERAYLESGGERFGGGSSSSS